MRKRKEKLKSLSVVALLAFLAFGCGSAKYANSSAAASEMAVEGSYDTAADSGGGFMVSDGVVAVNESAEASMPEEEGDGGGQTMEAASTQRKLIKNVNMDVETEHFDDLMAAVNEKTGQAGGYIEESYTYNGSLYNGNNRRNSNLTIRIPAGRLEEFLSDVSALSNVISQNESVTDVTLQYVDLESHKKALQAEQERLLELLSKAETIEDIISIESRLSEVRYQIESMESQLRTMDNQVSFSTVYLCISEVAKLTPVKEQTPWEKITTGFVRSLNNIGNGLVDFGIGFVINLPYIVFWAVILFLVFLLARLFYGRFGKGRMGEKREKKSRKKSGRELQGQEMTKDGTEESGRNQQK